MGSYVIVFDTETTIDTTQRLTFGMFRYCHVNDDFSLSCLAEGIIYADDLPDTDPDGYAALVAYAATHEPDVDILFEQREPNRRFELLSRDQFANRWLWRVGYKHQETVVGFNLPFDLTRLAVDVGEARNEYAGGFSLCLYRTRAGQPNTYRPRLRVKMLDSKKAFIGYATTNLEKHFPGNFVDLRTLTFALTSRSHSLASACESFGVTHGKIAAEQHGVITDRYVDYCRRDVQATAELYAQATQELARHQLDVPETHIYSPASLAKAYFRKMRIPQPLKRDHVPPEILGYAMSSFYGARAECHIRRTPMPVAVCDFTSMYPTVNTLMRMWELLTCDHVDLVHDVDTVRDLLDGITLDACFDPSTWSQFAGIARVRPDAAVLPVRSRYGGSSWNIGVNQLTADEDYWYAIPDLVASTLITGRPPTITDAILFRPVGQAATLRPIALHGSVPIDPRTDDFFPLIIERRAELKNTPTGDFLKVLANSGCYGIFAELIKRPDHTGPVESYSVTALGRRTGAPELPGPYTFPPIASAITAAARLMLAMFERCVTDLGGSWVFTDTDSMAVVAAETSGDVGGVRALSYADVDSIRDRFDQLNPYRNIPDLLKLEYQGWCYAISAKRYALYHLDDRGAVVVDKNSEHGLGHLLNPDDPHSPDTHWITQLWRHLISRELNIPSPEPPWLDRPAISRYSVSQTSLLRAVAAHNQGKPYPHTIKPANFILVAHSHKIQPSRYRHKVVPIAPYEPDATRWLNMEWADKRDPDTTFTVDTLTDTTELRAGVVYVQSYRDVLAAYAIHPEIKFNEPSGAPCSRGYRGTLHRKHIRATDTVYLGKESNEVELVQLGLMTAHEVTRTRRSDPWDRLYPLVMAVVGHYSINQLARAANIPRSTAGHILAGRRPSPEHETNLIRLACTMAADDLQTQYDKNTDPAVLLAKWKDTMKSRPTLIITTVDHAQLA